MKIIAWNKTTDKAMNPEKFPINGEWACFTDGNRVTKKQYHEPVEPDKTPIEMAWRDKELLRTDKLVVLPDYPRGKSKQSFLDYRQALADYPAQPDFPNGTRPEE